MVNDLIDGISIKLDQVFEGCEIYSDDVKQGLKEPCFFIAVLNPSQEQVLNNRYFRTYPFDVHYFPEKQGDNGELQGIASQLFELETITLVNGDVVRGTELHYETVDGVLHFFVNYNMFVNKQQTPTDKMEDLTIKG